MMVIIRNGESREGLKNEAKIYGRKENKLHVKYLLTLHVCKVKSLIFVQSTGFYASCMEYNKFIGYDGGIMAEEIVIIIEKNGDVVGWLCGFEFHTFLIILGRCGGGWSHNAVI